MLTRRDLLASSAATVAATALPASVRAMQTPIADVMTRDPKRIRADALASEAIAIMRPLRIDELPVVDDAGRPVGLIDVQDLVVLRMFDADQKA